MSRDRRTLDAERRRQLAELRASTFDAQAASIAARDAAELALLAETLRSRTLDVRGYVR